MNKAKRLFLLVLAGGTCTLAAAPMYSVKDLGAYSNVTGRDDGGPKRINRHARVIASTVTGGDYRSLLYDGAWTNLGTLGGNESVASGMNDSNRVVGFSRNASGTSRGFIWTPGAADGVPSNPQMREIGTFGGLESAAFDINNSGQVTGHAQTFTRDHAFRLSDGVLTDIGTLLPGGWVNSYGFGINDLGHITGTAYNGGFSVWQAFFYNGTSAIALGILTGKSSSGLAVNNTDHVVGYWTTTNDLDRAFHYHGGVMTDLGSLGGNYAYALGINNRNVIVGGSFVDTNDAVYHAFVAVSNTLVDLNTLLDTSEAGWTLLEARAINDAGQIVGVGRFGSADHMFLLNPASRVTDIKPSGPDALVSFTTVNGATYTLVGCDNVAGGTWANVATGISGNGEVVTVTNVGALTQPRQFYRVTVSSP